VILTVSGEETQQYSQILDQMFRLRARQFGVRRGWRVDVEDGKEIDRFDREAQPLYVLNVSSSGRLLGSLRLLQTTGPHMLADVFPETMGGLTAIRDPLVFESTRFCVDTEAGGPMSTRGIHVSTGELVLGLFELAQRSGLTNIVSVYDLFLERVLTRVGCLFDRLGPPVLYDDLKTVAGLFEVSDDAIASIRANCEIDWDVLSGDTRQLRASAS
jgi:acyl homoserine lactone synthase